MKIAGICFTKNGVRLGQKLAEAFPESRWFAKGRTVQEELPAGVQLLEGGFDALQDWAGARFSDSDALVFVGAAGIAVRAIAPHVADKKTDPAVLVIDEQGRFCISLLAGHIGGANALAEEVARQIGAVTVVTTATDLQGLFAVDVFATENELWISDMELAKEVSAALVAGGTVTVSSEGPLAGKLPRGLVPGGASDGETQELHIHIGTERIDGGAHRVLYLVPRTVTLGIGCRRGIAAEEIAAHVDAALAEAEIFPQAVCGVATIDVKKEEPGLLSFCRERGWPLVCFSAEELSETEGSFSASAFVADQVGVDNVCERSAARAGGELIMKKTSGHGVTCAAAKKERTITF